MGALYRAVISRAYPYFNLAVEIKYEYFKKKDKDFYSTQRTDFYSTQRTNFYQIL